MLSARAGAAGLISFLLLVIGTAPLSAAALLLSGAGPRLGSAVALRAAAGLVFAGAGGAAACFRVIRHRIAPE